MIHMEIAYDLTYSSCLKERPLYCEPGVQRDFNDKFFHALAHLCATTQFFYPYMVNRRRLFSSSAGGHALKADAQFSRVLPSSPEH